ncbi:Aste57867_12652 [Aphanomyces stellatus]|uniref:Aste57867_12652 protein n=1 Tax=Aphanomyces stellatus TaxID=120398 RepID=A0A485KWK1_9STRA|nr:hypothetical protein As57867_012606 [Aphanomyces stellatus]VFT89502.1 Aste57867_12652 [Aphanomyces stellatus]
MNSAWNIPSIVNEMSCFDWLLVCAWLVFVIVKVLAIARVGSMSRIMPGTASTSSPVVDTIFVFEGRTTKDAVHGLHSAYPKHQHHGGLVHASPTWLWELGYVFVNNDRLFQLDDLPKLALNCILQDELFYVYGYTVDGNLLRQELAHVLVEDLRLVDLCRLSLLPLRQETTQGTPRYDLYGKVGT